MLPSVCRVDVNSNKRNKCCSLVFLFPPNCDHSGLYSPTSCLFAGWSLSKYLHAHIEQKRLSRVGQHQTPVQPVSDLWSGSKDAAGKCFHLETGGTAPSCDRPLLVEDLHLQRDFKEEVTARSLRSIELYCFPIEQFALSRKTRRDGAPESAQGVYCLTLKSLGGTS